VGKILVEIDGAKKPVEFKGDKIKVSSLLELLNLYPETAVVVKGGQLLCDDKWIKDGEDVEVVIATSRG
jgi:sulfur carrier protein